MNKLRIITYILASWASICTLEARPLNLENFSRQTNIGYEKFIRLNQPQNKTKNSDWLEVGHRYKYKASNFSGKFEGDARFYLNNKEFSLSLSEAFLQYKSEGKSTYSLGRKRLRWHANEVFWQLDHFQGSRGFRITDTKQEGLTGLHYRTIDGPITTEVFLSYFYIPSLNPSVKIENGSVSSNSDWYKRPPIRTVISGNEVDIFYNLNSPNYRDLLVQKSLGIRSTINWGEKGSRGYLSGFTIYKPERRLRINAEAFYEPTIDKVVVNASPIVNHHVMFAGELKQQYKNTLTTLGVVTIDPNAKLGADFDSLSINIQNNRTLDSDFFKVEPNYNRETYAHYSTLYKANFLSLSLNYLHYFSDHIKGSDDFYSETVRWKKALGIGSSYQFRDWLSANMNLRYDLERKDNVLNGQVQITPWLSSIITLGVELLKSPASNSYWSAYRANDTFYINTSYIF